MTTMTTNGEDNNPLHVLIVGAGISGLLIAQGLRKEGIKCTVYESEPSASHARPREWGMSVQWALPLLEKYLPDDLSSQLRESTANDPAFDPPDPSILPTYNGATGELLKNIELNRMIRVSRRRFRAFCAREIDVQYGKVFKSFSPSDHGTGVTLTFEDGTTATGSLLVGTDGAHSRLRVALLGPEKARASTMPYSAVNVAVKYDDAEKALFVRQCHPIMTMAIHPDGLWLWISIQEIPDPDRPETWTFQLQTTWRQVEGEDVTSLAGLKAKAETFGEPFRSANLWIPDGTTLHANRISYWRPVPWDTRKGTVILAGDAAHPMPFQRGQGLNHCIADAVKLVDCLKSVKAKETSLEDAMTDYMTEMVSRAGDEVAVSKENTEMLHDWKRMMESPIMQRGGRPRTERN